MSRIGSEARHEVAVEAGGVDPCGVRAHPHVDVVGPPALGGLLERLRAGVDLVVAAALAQIADLTLACLGFAARSEGFAALAAGLVAPGHLVGNSAAGALAGVDAHAENRTADVGGNVGELAFRANAAGSGELRNPLFPGLS